MDGLYAKEQQGRAERGTRARTARAYGPLRVPLMRSGSDGDEVPREVNANKMDVALVAYWQALQGWQAVGGRARGGVSGDAR